MAEIKCEQCSTMISVPEGYDLPLLKCPNCGAHQKSPGISDEPTYRLLDAAARTRSQQPIDLNTLPKLPEEPLPKKQKWRNITEPVLVSAARKAKEATVRKSSGAARIIGSVVDERLLIEDALGSSGMEMLMQLAASYMDELSKSARVKGKAKAIQALMRSKVSAELADRALAYAEKSEEIETLLWENYRSNMFRGLGIFAAGLVISVLVHALAQPGWEFVIFQTPFAVGFAYAVNAGINMAGLKIPALRNEKIHYGFVVVATLMILAYVVVGIWL